MATIQIEIDCGNEHCGSCQKLWKDTFENMCTEFLVEENGHKVYTTLDGIECPERCQACLDAEVKE